MDNETITANGLSFIVRVHGDDTNEAPWEREDGHGPVRYSRAGHAGYPKKAPGERVLDYDHGRGGYVYGYNEALEIAKRDGWGIAPESRERIERVLGRAMTAAEVAERAVMNDLQRMRGFIRNEWGYVGVVVTLLDVDGNPTQHGDSLWGIESDATEFIEDAAHEVAREIAARVGRCSFVSYGSSGRQRVRAKGNGRQVSA